MSLRPLYAPPNWSPDRIATFGEIVDLMLALQVYDRALTITGLAGDAKLAAIRTDVVTLLTGTLFPRLKAT